MNHWANRMSVPPKKARQHCHLVVILSTSLLLKKSDLTEIVVNKVALHLEIESFFSFVTRKVLLLLQKVQTFTEAQEGNGYIKRLAGGVNL